jgi:multiple sugar transport system ATP-binding protein
MKLQRVRLQNVAKSFESGVLFDDVSIEIEPGEFLAILGPSGGGKSTLLNMISGLTAPSSGRVFIGGLDVTEMEPHQRNIAMVFQSYALYPTMSVRKNIGFSLQVNGTSAREVALKVAAIAKLLKIDDLLDRRPGQLSGGQQQRVAIGRALIRDPAVLLLDEPMSNLDAQLRSEMRLELRKLHEASPRTTLYVTHDQIEAMTLGTRIAVLDKGKVQQCDRPDLVYRRPANRVVASFVGSPAMKFIEGTLARSGDCAALSNAAGLLLPLPGLVLSSQLEFGQAVVLGLRPEYVRVRPPSVLHGAAGRILSIENTGPDRYALLGVAGSDLMCRLDPGIEVEPQQNVAVTINGKLVSLFDPVGGHRLN